MDQGSAPLQFKLLFTMVNKTLHCEVIWRISNILISTITPDTFGLRLDNKTSIEHFMNDISS